MEIGESTGLIKALRNFQEQMKGEEEKAILLNEDAVDDWITNSRRGAIENPISNWKKSPVIGNGFQVSEEMGWVKSQDMKDIISAPVEKGTWAVAILEEGGSLGMAIFLIWVLVLGSKLWSRKAYIGVAMLFSFLVSNLGEFTIFSLTSTGCFLWALVLFGIIMDELRLKEYRSDPFFM